MADDAYTYDQVGNRLSSADVGDVIAHNARNELRVYGNLTFSYDAQGNQTDRRENGAIVQHFIYDAENRLIRVEDGTGGLIARYEYDPFGRRLYKEVNGERTYFFYADEGLIAEFDETGKELRSYGWQPDATWGSNPLWLKTGGNYYWYQNDHLGTPQTLVDSSGHIVWQATYTAFGNASVEIETIENNLRFPGQYFDAETGLHYNFHRYYDPLTGRYTQPDPIGFAGRDVNWYAYVGNDPTGGMDPLGLLHEAAYYANQWHANANETREAMLDLANGPFTIALAALVNTAVDVGAMMGVDLLYTGEGIAEGTVSGVISDTARVAGIVWIGGKAIQIVRGGSAIAACGVAEAANTPIFGAGDLVYGPSAGGKLRALQQQAGGKTLTDILTSGPGNKSWAQASIDVMEHAISKGNKVHFDLTNMKDISGVLKNTGEYANTVTAQELRYIQAHWAKFKDSVIFYQNGAKVSAPW